MPLSSNVADETPRKYIILTFLCPHSFLLLQIKYKQDSAKELSKFHLPMDMLEVAHAKKAQSLVSDQDYRLTLHQYTSLPDDMKLQAAKKAYSLQSEVKETVQCCRQLLLKLITIVVVLFVLL